MEQYISKAAVVAEIERLKADALQKKGQCKRSGLEKIMHQIGAYNKILSFLDNLEVKEVDLEKEWKEYFKYRGDVATVNIKHLAKHFFELGLKVQKGEQV